MKTTGPESVTGVTPYHDSRQKSEQIEQMFDSIAPAYDFMNTAMTFGLHNVWRSRALDAVMKSLGSVENPEILDIATGTGDVAFDLHRRCPEALITGVDLSDGMLDVARKKLASSDEATRKAISFEQGDSLNLGFDTDKFNLITVAYGVRNFQQLERGLAEMHRVLKPGGHLCIIELSEPRRKAMRMLYRLYARHIIPVIGRLVSGDSRAYSYLPESIAAAPQREEMTRIMSDAGLTGCSWKSLTFGAVTYYLAVKH